METVSTKLPPQLVDAIDRLVAQGGFANRSDFLRQAVREALEKRGA